MKEIMDAMKNQWRCKGEANPIKNKKFLFSIDSKSDRDNIVRKQPWIILGQVLVLHLVLKQNLMLDPPILEVSFWVILNGLPLEYHSWDTIHELAATLDVVHKDTPTKGETRRMEAYNEKINLNIKKPLPKGVRFHIEEGKLLEVPFIYEHYLFHSVSIA